MREVAKCDTVRAMNRSQTLQKESLLLALAVTMMAVKIMAGIIIVHQMRLRAARKGLAFVEDDD